MHRLPLPLVDPARTEFGLARTACACGECVRNCHHVPGYLIPADLDRIRRHVAPRAELCAWAREHLLASPGAVVLQAGRFRRIPTLVPARRPDGACLFLTPESRCRIHAVSPFGCAFFDAHQPGEEADRRSRRGLQAVLEAWRDADLYARVWIALHDAGLRAPAPEVCRRRLQEALTGRPP